MGKRPRIPQKRLPAETRLLRLRTEHQKLISRYERVRRLLWLAVKEAGGRVEIMPDVFTKAMGAPSGETLVKTEIDEGRNKVVLVFSDAKGQRLPASEPKLIIEA